MHTQKDYPATVTHEASDGSAWRISSKAENLVAEEDCGASTDYMDHWNKMQSHMFGHGTMV